MAGNCNLKFGFNAVLLLGFSLFSLIAAQAQVFPENPPIPAKVEVNNSQFLNFGTFTGGLNGGTVSVDFTGEPISTGEVFLLRFGTPTSPALFELTANPGTLVNIVTQPDYILYGDNGGQIRLEINSFSTGATFITTALPPETNPIYVGGTLYIGNEAESPAGFYSGTFSLMFNYE